MAEKTTIYLPHDLKAAVKREARRRGSSEASVIRDAVAAAVSRPRPTAGLLDGDAFASDVDKLVVAFGERPDASRAHVARPSRPAGQWAGSSGAGVASKARRTAS